MSKVSIIMPTYNRAHVIGEAIRSVIEQTYGDFEIIVVDDGSTDDTEEYCAGLGESRVRYVRQENRGASTARNRGIAESTGSYLLFLDSDDVLYNTALAKLVGVMEEHPECGAAYCGFVVTTGPGEILSSSPLDFPSGDVLARMCMEQLCVPHSVLARREAVRSSGGFDERLRLFEDWDFWIRIAAETPFAFVPEYLVEYRRWAPGASALTPEFYDAGKMVIGKYREYYKRGRFTKAEWRAVRYRFQGHFRDTWTALAFSNYSQGNYGRCAACALRGFVAWPVSLLNRGVWSILVKSALRQLGALRTERVR